MAVKALNLSKRITHELSSDPDKGTENATKFELGAVDSRVMGVLKDKAISLPVAAFDGAENATASMNINQVNFEIVVHGLKGWTNYQDAEGRQMEFCTGEEVIGKNVYVVASRDLVATLDNDDIQELADRINSINTLSEVDRKN